MKKLLKKFCTIAITLTIITALCQTKAFANFSNTDTQTIQGEKGSITFSIKNDDSLKVRNSFETTYILHGDHIEAITPIVNIDKDRFYTTISIPDDYYIIPFSNAEHEKEALVIYNNHHEEVGLIDMPVIIKDDGGLVYGKNIIENKKIYHIFPEYDFIEIEDASISISVYATMPWTYYFYGIGYNDSSAKHDFWMQPISATFINEKETVGTYINSWNSLNNGMNSKLTGLDKTKWINNPTILKWQYRCHYEYVSPSGYWNLEEYRKASSYTQVVLSGCNP